MRRRSVIALITAAALGLSLCSTGTFAAGHCHAGGHSGGHGWAGHGGSGHWHGGGGWGGAAGAMAGTATTSPLASPRALLLAPSSPLSIAIAGGIITIASAAGE